MPYPRTSFILLAALMVSGCAPLQWVKADAAPQQIEQDLTQCRQEAWREARWHGFLSRPLGPTLSGRPFLGWRGSMFGDPFGDEFMEESRLTDFCMRAKGYELTPVGPAKQSQAPAETIQPSASGTCCGRP